MKFTLLLSTVFLVISFQLVKSDCGIKHHSRSGNWVPILKKLLESEHILSAGIYNSFWASTPAFDANELDFDNILRGLRDYANFKSIDIGPTTYKVIKANSNFFQAEIGDESRQGVFGFVSPGKTILVGKYKRRYDDGYGYKEPEYLEPVEALAAMKEAEEAVEQLEKNS